MSFDRSDIAMVYQSELRDPRKRRQRAPRSEWIEFYDPGTGRWRRCKKWEREFETRERGPVRDISPAIWRPSPKLVSRAPVEDSTGAAWVPPADDSDVRRELMGAWLGGIGQWTHFASWTFSRIVTVAGAMHFGATHLGWLAWWDVDSEFGPLTSQYQPKNARAREKAAGNRLQAFLATERGETGGLLHLHALLGGISHLPAFCGVRLPEGEWGVKCCMVHSWPCGHARVFPYDPVLGAKYYVSKYVIKGHLAEWELLGKFHCSGKACASALH